MLIFFIHLLKNYLNKAAKLSCFLFYAFIFLSIDVLARPGGGGGHGGGFSGGGGLSGGHGGGIDLPLPVVLLLFIIAAVWKYYEKQEEEVYNAPAKIQRKLHDEEEIHSLLKDLPDFDRYGFYKKVGKLFSKMQIAWQEKNISSIRQYISDGVYQRFNAQFIMMNELAQTNSINEAKLLDKEIVAVENDGNFHVLHVLIRASNNDVFRSDRFAELNSGGFEEYVEYWTFVKKIAAKPTIKQGFFSNDNCPNCGDSLTNKLGEISICPSCKTLLSNGDHDWILSEITQAEQFASTYSKLKIRKGFFEKLAFEGYSGYEFSPQYTEDKASNAYLQIKIAGALCDTKRINRFCSDSLTQKLKLRFNRPYLYNRLYTKSVDLINVLASSKEVFAVFSVSCAQQKIVIENNELKLINKTTVEVNEILILSRARTSFTNKYNVLAHNCSACGAPVEDSLQLTCHHCGSFLNDNSKDWIVEDLCTKNEYNAFRDRFNNMALTKKQEQKVEAKKLEVKDYALNNMMLVAMADGEMHDKERDFLNYIAKKLGYNSKKINELFNQVSAKSMTLKMPSDIEKAKKVLKLMRSLANSDGAFKAKEEEIINEAEKLSETTA